MSKKMIKISGRQLKLELDKFNCPNLAFNRRSNLNKKIINCDIGINNNSLSKKSLEPQTRVSPENLPSTCEKATLVSKHLRSRKIILNTVKKKDTKNNAMAVAFDHMYINCGDSKISIDRDIEIQHLRELNLLHVDLIQQQAEQLIEKDKIIKALKEENQNLSSRLERNRRVSLSLQKKSPELTPISVQTDFPLDLPVFSIKEEPCSHSVKSKSPCLSSPKSYIQSPLSPAVSTNSMNSKSPKDFLISSDFVKIPKKESPKKSISPSLFSSVNYPTSNSPCIRLSPRERRCKREERLLSTINASTPKEKNLISPLESRRSISPYKRIIADEESPILKRIKGFGNEPLDAEGLAEISREAPTNHSLRSRDKSKSANTSSVSEEDVTHDGKGGPLIIINSTYAGEEVKVRAGGILSTNQPYYLPTGTLSEEFNESSENEVTHQQVVEIPSWTMRHLSSLYVMEGTENLEDEVFLKRHSKLEHDERRRKRWDLQRLREQRQYEKLLERYEGRNSLDEPLSCCTNSLWPNPESALAVQVDDSLPVCAFGQTMALIPQSDFSLPWLSGRTSGQLQPRKNT